MLGVLGIVSAAIALGVIGTVTGAASFGLSFYSTIEAKKNLEEQKAKAAQEAAKAERKASVMHLQQFKETMNVHNRGLLTAKKELLQKEREQASYGSPVSN